jgi:hypothetical protein
MIRIMSSVGLFLALWVIERAFVSALPWPLAALPLTLTVGVYLRQHLSLRDGLAWIVAAGVLNDLTGLTSFPLSTVSALVAAAVCHLTSREVFSNRSLYGILACTGASALAASLTRVLLLGALAVFRDLSIDGAAEFRLLAASFFTSVLFVIFLFRFAKRIRKGLASIFIIAAPKG